MMATAAVDERSAIDYEAVGHRLADAGPEDVLRWAVETFYPRLTMATAFGPEGCAILHMLSKIEPRVRVFNLDTGYQFAETLQLRDRIAEKYGIEVELVGATQSVAEYEAANGGAVYAAEPDRCCHDRKIVPLRKALEGLRRLDLVDPRRPVVASGSRRRGGLGREVRPGEGQPPAPLDASRRLGLRGGERRPLQPPARQRIPVDRLLALHPGGVRRRDRRAGRALGRPGEDRMRPCTRSTAASSEPTRRFYARTLKPKFRDCGIA